MNEPGPAQLHFDFRTGLPTAISGDHVTWAQRAACTAINRNRVRGIQEATRPAPPGEPFEADGWHAAVAARAVDWGVPLIPLERMGFAPGGGGFVASKYFRLIGWGAEAYAWADDHQKCVYKLFHLLPKAVLGKRLVLEREGEDRWRAVPVDGDLKSTLDKVALLHEAGGCPTEIIGLAESGDFLIVKQPLCLPLLDFEDDREAAASKLMAAIPRPSLGIGIRLFWLHGDPWCLGDLHERNIMREASGEPTVIDALTGPLPPVVLRELPSLQHALSRAKALREGRDYPPEDITAGVIDDEL